MNRFDLLNKIQNILKDNLVICNIGLPSQELYKISDQQIGRASCRERV